MSLATCVFFLALHAAAHEGYPISPAYATLRMEPDRTVADLRVDSIFWIEEVSGLNPMPAQNWPDESRARVESYVNAHFHLSAGGGLLNGKLVEARYRQLPWEVNEEGSFFLRMLYPLVPSGAALSVRAHFYEEYRREMMAQYQGRKIPFANDYRTFVDIPGRHPLRLTLTPDAPSFTVPADETRRTAFAMAREALLRGAQAALGAAAGFPTLLAIVLCLGAGPPDRATCAILCASAASGFAAGRFLNAPPWLIWAATLGGALAAQRRHAALMSGAAVCALGLTWCTAAKPLLPHCALAFPSALIGVLAAGAALLCVAWCGLRAEYRRLTTVCESRVDELFARRVRLTATVLAMVGAYGLWQSLQR